MATNYEKYFGTPEMAAQFMDHKCVDAEVACILWQQTLTPEKKEGKTFQQLAVEWLQEENNE